MGTSFCFDLTYGFRQFIVDYPSLRNNNLPVKDILKIFPKEYLLANVSGCHTGQCNIFDWYLHEYNGYITGFGNERVALLFHHYKVAGRHWDEAYLFHIKEYETLLKANFITIEIGRDSDNLCEQDITMILMLCELLQQYLDEAI